MLSSKKKSSENFVGVILAAGVGSRLRPMTNTLPKCMVKVAGKSILEYQIDAYRKAGISEIIIVVGYEGQAVKNYCKYIKDIEIIIIENAEYENTNNMYSLYLAAPHIGERAFILNNGDLAVDSSLVDRIVTSPLTSGIAVDVTVFNDESMKVSVNDDGYIFDISKKIQQAHSSGCSIDFYKFSLDDGKVFLAEVTKIIEDESNLKDWTEVALQRLLQKQTLKFSIIDVTEANWVEIDNYADLAFADRIFSEFDKRLADIEIFLFDLDGTIYVGNEVVRGAPEIISWLKESGKKTYFLSNNSSKNKHDYTHRLRSLGIDVSEEDVILSSDAVIEYLKNCQVEKIHILGTISLKKIFLEAGFRIDVPDPDYIVIGYDTELDYKKLISACGHINNGVDILATHCDVFCPSENGPLPDIGSLIEMIRLTTGKSPVKIFGKPNMEMIQPLLGRLKVNTNKILFIGDRLHTDVLMATQVGSPSLLVLTGETSRDVLQNSSIQPTFVLRSVSDMYSVV